MIKSKKDQMIEKLKKTLAYYANPRVYVPYIDNDFESDIFGDKGYRARQTLLEIDQIKTKGKKDANNI